ncbi:MAG: DUF4173 domain-containing protein [Flavobacteriales bacterium]
MSAVASAPIVRTFAWPLVLVGLTTFLFDLLFWQRDAGVNFLLFNGVVTAVLLARYGWSAFSTPARWALLANLLAGCMVVVHDSVIAIVASVVSLIAVAAFAHEPRLRSLFYAAIQGVTGFVVAPVKAVAQLGHAAPSSRTSRSGWRWLRLGVLPVLLLLLFTQLYRAGNPKFHALTAGFMDGLFDALGDVFERLLTAHTLFVLFGAVLCTGLVLHVAPDAVRRLEVGYTDILVRTRLKRPNWAPALALDPLERERRMGMILLVAVNALLFVVNAIDIDWVWFGFEVPADFSLKQFVHEGTWMLIISILLSMVILMYLFRWNQNFYVRSKGLKWLAFAWLIQNFILGVSVFLRNYHYISFHGLAYKRIGVMVFLVLVLVGLVTLFIKIRDRKSFFFLARINAWAAFAAIMGLATIDWDSTIVRYNLAHWNQGEIDVDNYLDMSDKVLPLLYANLDVVEAQMAKHSQNEVRWVRTLDPVDFKRSLQARYERFQDRYADTHWQEWSLADRRTAQALEAFKIQP